MANIGFHTISLSPAIAPPAGRFFSKHIFGTKCLKACNFNLILHAHLHRLVVCLSLGIQLIENKGTAIVWVYYITVWLNVCGRPLLSKA